MKLSFEVRPIEERDIGRVGYAVTMIDHRDGSPHELDWSGVDELATGFAQAGLGPYADQLREMQHRAQNMTTKHRDELVEMLAITQRRARG